MNSKKTKRTRCRYVLSQGDTNFNVVTKKYLTALSREDAMSLCALTWLDLHRLMSASAMIGEDLYMSKGKTKIKITDGLLNALDVLEATHPMIITQVKSFNLSQNGFKVFSC